MEIQTLLQRWQLTAEELTEIVDENPSLRGFLLGYVGEYKLRKLIKENPEVQAVQKPDDHDRKSKNDLIIVYRNQRFTLEVKSLQTNSIKRSETLLYGSVQVDASDRRTVRLPNGMAIETTCLLRGEFDVLAINLFQFRQIWQFAFILNRDLPTSRSRKYTDTQREYLLATSIKVTDPISPPYVPDLFVLLDLLSAERKA